MVDVEKVDIGKLFDEMLIEAEKERRENPCCYNCRHYYTEYGVDFCKYWGSPKVDILADKCCEWN